MATKIIKAWVDGAIQEIEVEDIISPEQPLSVEERVDILEDKHEVVITDGNLLVGNGTADLEEMTPEDVLSHINGASIMTLTSEEFEAIPDDDINANTLYMLTDAEEETGNSILYTEQSLTEEQKLQARNNIGIGETIVDTLAELDLISTITDNDGSLAENDGTLLVTRNDDIFLPEVTAENNGDVLKVVDGKWAVDTIEIPKMPEINYPVTSVNGFTGDVSIDIPDSIPTPTTAQVGQTIIVKAIDESGKPTEWECVNLLALDTTLTQEDQAADAKAVGDALANVGNPTDEQVNTAVSAYLEENPVQAGTNIYVGADKPTNGAEYWLDTSEDENQITIYTVETTLTNASIDNTAAEVSEGDAYVANISANDGYTLTGADISVVMGGVDVTSSAYNNGKISIANVTGNISISISAVVIADDTVTYTITNTLTNVNTSNYTSSIEENSSYTATLTAMSGYELDTVSVTMGGTDVTSTVYADGVISISAVTGDVVITASAVSTGDGNYIYKLADISSETLEGKKADGDNKDNYTRYKIRNIKTGDIVYLASINADNTTAWYDGTTGYGFNNTSMFTAKFQDNYAWKRYSWTADKDYDYLYFASNTSLLEDYPNSYAYIEKTEEYVDTGEEDTGETTVTLSSISATYSGGDVTVGTALTDLTDIVVTATYSDDSTATVIDYTLSGEIVEGENTVTVTYEGVTTTFIVTGIAEEIDEGTWEEITLTNKAGGTPWAIYSDDGTTKMKDIGGQGCCYTNFTFDEDTEVKFEATMTTSLYSGVFVGSASNAVTGGDLLYAVIVSEPSGNGYYETGEVCTATVTVKAGYQFAVAGMPMTKADIKVWKKVS